MILSFHPCIMGDQNIICAGRNPGLKDLSAIRSADAVILPQGCSSSLYEMARNNCANVFPNFDARFRYPGKIGQIRLFRSIGAHHPDTLIFEDMKSFCSQFGLSKPKLPFNYPFVFKLDWGGEGDTVFLIPSDETFASILKKTAQIETPSHKGFLIQKHIPSRGRSLRVVVIGSTVISYWRVQNKGDSFYTGLGKGAEMDSLSDPNLQQKAAALVKHVSRQTEINLAGYDVIFSATDQTQTPLLLEINYFFGRKGLGGSEPFYQLLELEVRRWIKNLRLN